MLQTAETAVSGWGVDQPDRGYSTVTDASQAGRSIRNSGPWILCFKFVVSSLS